MMCIDISVILFEEKLEWLGIILLTLYSNIFKIYQLFPTLVNSTLARFS
jgi:hypothetical protein